MLIFTSIGIVSFIYNSDMSLERNLGFGSKCVFLHSYFQFSLMAALQFFFFFFLIENSTGVPQGTP